MRRFIGLLVLLVAVASALDDDVELNGAAGLKAYVTKTGGKIRVYRDVMTRNGTKSTGKVEISLDRIEEVDDNLDAAKLRSKVSSFANVNFTVQSMLNVQLGNSSGVFADCLNCSGVLPLTGVDGDRATAVSLAVCAIKTNGSLTMNDEETNVTAGQLKFTFTMSSWGWAGPNNKLAVDINIKTPPNRNIVNGSDAHRKPTKFSLGGDAFMEFSRQTFLDNNWVSMPAGYPMYRSRGAINVFRLIFNQFNNTAVYDPNVEVGYQVDDSGSTDTNGTSTATVDSTKANGTSTAATNTADKNATTMAAVTSTDKNGASATAVVCSVPLLAAVFLQILARL
jgi:hypothetical protein